MLIACATDLGPIIGSSVGEYLALRVESAARDWLVELLRSLQLRASVFVPEREATVGTDCCESAVHRVKRNVVDLKEKQKHKLNLCLQDMSI